MWLFTARSSANALPFQWSEELANFTGPSALGANSTPRQCLPASTHLSTPSSFTFQVPAAYKVGARKREHGGRKWRTWLPFQYGDGWCRTTKRRHAASSPVAATHRLQPSRFFFLLITVSPTWAAARMAADELRHYASMESVFSRGHSLSPDGTAPQTPQQGKHRNACSTNPECCRVEEHGGLLRCPSESAEHADDRFAISGRCSTICTRSSTTSTTRNI